MQSAAPVTPAILFEPDGYRTDIEKLMGRQAAGQGFLRAAVQAAAGRPVYGYTARKQSAQVFAQTVAQIDPKAQGHWVTPTRTDLLRQLRHLYLPGPGLGEFASQRLRAGPDAWSLTGVTHTTATHTVMDSIKALPLAPVMPWDALVCTSSAVKATIDIVLDAQRDYLRWRLGKDFRWTLPQFPVIPLGVHCKDFDITPAERAAARTELGIADDEVVFLFVGRLSFHAKAHPHAMYAGLQAAARKTGRRCVLVQSGWFANDAIEQAFRTGAQAACPDVRCIFTDGRQRGPRRASWGAADVFISLSDNIQETFGLTPIEAMAAGLPVVVTDWDGYKDTVRDGIDGYRIRTWSPQGSAGDPLAAMHEAGIDNYDLYCGLACMHVSVDMRMLVERLAALVDDPDLRKRMGGAGQERARDCYDWQVIYGAYQSLWLELDRLRATPGEAVRQAPAVDPARLDPFLTFAHYPTHVIEPSTVVARRDGQGVDTYETLAAHMLFNFGQRDMPAVPLVRAICDTLGTGPASVDALARALALPTPALIRAVAMLAKMGIVELGQSAP